MKTPDTVGVPEIVMVLADQLAVTPAGNPVGVPIPVAPVVVCVTVGMAAFKQTAGEVDAALAVFEKLINEKEPELV